MEQPAPYSHAVVWPVGDGGGRGFLMALDGRGFSVSHAPVAFDLGRNHRLSMSDPLAFGGVGGRLVVGPPENHQRFMVMWLVTFSDSSFTLTDVVLGTTMIADPE